MCPGKTPQLSVPRGKNKRKKACSQFLPWWLWLNPPSWAVRKYILVNCWWSILSVCYIVWFQILLWLSTRGKNPTKSIIGIKYNWTQFSYHLHTSNRAQKQGMSGKHKAGDTSTTSWLKPLISDFKNLQLVSEKVQMWWLLASTETCWTGGTICFFAEKLTRRFPVLMDNNGKNLCNENYS